MSRRPRRNRPPRLDVDPVAAFADDVGVVAGDSPAKVPIVHRPEPPSLPTPLGPCGPGSRQQPGVDGRVPAGSAKDGLSCNVTLLGHQGTEGGFKVFRYSDDQGHECAFYDTTLMFPLNALNPGGGSAGVAVLDMSDPSHPVQTDTLTTPPMRSPHESVNLNPQRGLLAAVNGNLLRVLRSPQPEVEGAAPGHGLPFGSLK